MARAYKKKPGEQTDIARERMKILLQKAEDVFNEDRSLANRYIELARKISMKFKVRMPSELKRKICPHCYIFLMPGVNLRVRLSEKKLIYYCLECKHFWRMPYIKEARQRRKTKGKKD